jgi:hypothetical protein
VVLGQRGRRAGIPGRDRRDVANTILSGRLDDPEALRRQLIRLIAGLLTARSESVPASLLTASAEPCTGRAEHRPCRPLTFCAPEGRLWLWPRALGLAARNVNSTWWLGLVAGILEILLGFWASQQRFPARAALLLLWVGFFALFRGISEIVIAFELRSRQRA